MSVRSRDRGGKTPSEKWVDINHATREQAKRMNDGVLPYSPALETTDFPNKDVWSEDNLPHVLFYIIPPRSKYADQKPRALRNLDGTLVTAGNRTVHDFEILPRRIAVDVKGWLVETWRRIDTRITYQDILDRMEEDTAYCGSLHLKKPSKNSLQNDCRRSCRKILNLWLEYGRRDISHRTEVECVEGLTYDNVVHNTVLPRCAEFRDRLVKLTLQRETGHSAFKAVPMKVTSENYERTTLPLKHFLQNIPEIGHGEEPMTSAMLAAWELCLVLQERAHIHGLTHWSKLARTCLPVSWFDRTVRKSEENDTYDGGCHQCTWSLDRDDRSEPSAASQDGSPKPTKRSREPSEIGDTPANKRRCVQTRATDTSESEYEIESDSPVQTPAISRRIFSSASPSGTSETATPNSRVGEFAASHKEVQGLYFNTATPVDDLAHSLHCAAQHNWATDDIPSQIKANVEGLALTNNSGVMKPIDNGWIPSFGQGFCNDFVQPTCRTFSQNATTVESSPCDASPASFYTLTSNHMVNNTSSSYYNNVPASTLPSHALHDDAQFKSSRGQGLHSIFDESPEAGICTTHKVSIFPPNQIHSNSNHIIGDYMLPSPPERYGNELDVPTTPSPHGQGFCYTTPTCIRASQALQFCTTSVYPPIQVQSQFLSPATGSDVYSSPFYNLDPTSHSQPFVQTMPVGHPALDFGSGFHNPYFSSPMQKISTNSSSDSTPMSSSTYPTPAIFNGFDQVSPTPNKINDRIQGNLLLGIGNFTDYGQELPLQFAGGHNGIGCFDTPSDAPGIDLQTSVPGTNDEFGSLLNYDQFSEMPAQGTLTDCS